MFLKLPQITSCNFQLGRPQNLNDYYLMSVDALTIGALTLLTAMLTEQLLLMSP